MIEEVGCWNCALDGVKSWKPVCPDCGTEIAHHCKEYSHEKIIENANNIIDTKRLRGKKE